MINSPAVKKSTKQIVREPLELLRTMDRQVRNIEASQPTEQRPPEQPHEGVKTISKEEEANLHEKSRRLTLAYKEELADIARIKYFKEIQMKIIHGEDVDLTEIKGLSMDQMQVLYALKEAMDGKNPRKNSLNGVSLVEPSSKPKRGLLQGVKTKIDRLQRKNETRMDPSG